MQEFRDLIKAFGAKASTREVKFSVMPSGFLYSSGWICK